jgi:hypothetical protein
MDKLKFINAQMTDIAVPYEFGEWTSDVTYPYFVGEFMEDPIETEDGSEESTLLLTGFNRGSMTDLLRVKERIRRHFPPLYGLRAQTDSGAIAVYYENSTYIPTGEAELKRLQINLKIKEWKGAK